MDDMIVKKACMEIMKTDVHQQRYRLKQTYFDPFPLHMVTKTSPLKFMSNEQCNVNTQREQMDDLSQQVKESEAARIRDQEEMKK
jgi:hypothetical protein